MLKGLRFLHQASYGKIRNEVEWRENGNILELVLNFRRLERGIIYVLGDDTTFKELTSRDFFKNTQFKFPKDFDTNTSISHYLLKEQTPLSIELRDGDDVIFLNNRAREPETSALLRGFSNKKGILRLVNNTEMDMGQTRSVLTQAYLKLQAESFCRNNNYIAKTELTPALREEILNYLCYRNQTSEQEQLVQLEANQNRQWQTIIGSQQEIREIEANADKVLRLYQWGAIGITAIHLLTFGYMIFFVDWLGWDIIEPITFSVSCLYLLIALRFYRKFRRDRNEQSIRDRFRELILSPKKLMHLKAAHINLGRQREYLKQTELKLLLSRNRLHQSTTLNDAILQ